MCIYLLIQLVVRHIAVGNNDIGWYTLSICAECREAVPIAAQRTQNGKTTVLLTRNVSLAQILFGIDCFHRLS